MPVEAETVTLVPSRARLPLASFTVTLIDDGLLQMVLAGEADTVTAAAVVYVGLVGYVG